MFVAHQPEMALFHCAPCTASSFTVSFHGSSPPSPNQNTSIEISYTPQINSLKKITIDQHTDPMYPAYIMPSAYNDWFSTYFGYEVILAYLGDSLGVAKEDPIADSWKATITSLLPSAPSENITFSDGAPLLVVSEASLEALHPLLGGEEKVVLEKFRPNIVVSDPDLKAWDEDYWSSLSIPTSNIKIVLTSNCARCTSINVDLSTGRMGTNSSGSLLKKMMKERRVDPGNKWEPIFGRYGFPVAGGEVKVGDEVVVERAEEKAVWSEFIPPLPFFCT